MSAVDAARPLAAVFGISGPRLTAAEREFFAVHRPAGAILFARNIETPGQVSDLVADLRDACGAPQLLVLIDQEGGRVARLRPPHWDAYPPAAKFAELYTQDPAAAVEAARLNAQLIAEDLADLGINVDCAPVLDIPAPGSHDIIGDRAYGRMPEPVIALGRAVCEGLLAGGVLPVIKHVPGHGRATADSHAELPVVTASRDELARSDFVPFRALNDMPCAMTAHVRYDALDPTASASESADIIGSVIRGEIGFDGLLFSDDLAMKALSGTQTARTKRVLAAGCDVALHCTGDFAEMVEVAAAAGAMSEAGLRRLGSARRCLASRQPLDRDRAKAMLGASLARAGWSFS